MKLNHKAINYLNISIAINKIEAAIVSQQREAQDPMYVLPISTRSLREK
jgi:hypothetical protein